MSGDLLPWASLIATKDYVVDTAAGLLTLIVAKEVVGAEFRYAHGSVRCEIPHSIRKLLKHHRISDPMIGRICGAAGRIAAHPQLRGPLSAGNIQAIVFACDAVLLDERAGQITLKRLDLIGKRGAGQLDFREYFP